MAKPILTTEFREFLSLLNAHRVKYLVVGGFAVGFHGHPRYTKDIDLWISGEPDNAQQLSDCLRAYFGSSPSLEQLTSPRLLLRIGAVPNQIELMTRIDGVEFEPCYARRLSLEIDGIPIPFLHLSDLRQNKASSGRPQDLADLDNLPPEDIGTE